jgi:protein-S-isoprenylcysteine O-methyltransferase Ste14
MRHILSILLLPFVVVIIVPYLLAGASFDLARWLAGSTGDWLLRAAGLISFGAGFFLLAWCVRLFARVGQGTLAPWDPTRRLVAVGPYRYVRNPMISGVAFMLVGQSLFWGSWRVGAWGLIFVIVNHIYFLLSEEPGLERRFGESYRAYKANVPRWIPRRKPWNG